MKAFRIWLFDTFCGIFTCSGISLFLWLIIYSVFKFPEINFKHTVFMVEFISLIWIFNFIFHFSSPIITKGILHSIICFMLSVILFSANFGFVPSAQMLLICMLIFFSVYSLLLYGIVNLSKKLNSPLRHFPEWVFKLRPQNNKKSYERD